MKSFCLSFFFLCINSISLFSQTANTFLPTNSNSQQEASNIIPGCTNTSPFGTTLIPANNNLTSISICNSAGEYSTINGAVAGQTLEFAMQNVGTGAFITIHSGSSAGPIIASGNTPLSFLNSFTGNLYAHWSLNDLCTTDGVCHSTSVQCISCPSPGCTNASSFGSTTIPGNNVQATISTCSSAGEYSTISGAMSGQTLQVTMSNLGSGTFITIHEGSSNGPVVASGSSPLTFLNSFTGTLYAHWSINAACLPDDFCHVTTVQELISNHPPEFVNGTFDDTLFCENSINNFIDEILKVNDVDIGQTLTWSILSLPTHGSVNGLSASTISTGNIVSPSGITYSPANGYSGTDAFTISVSDGFSNSQFQVNISVNTNPTPSINGNTSFCPGNQTSLDAGIGYLNYNWSTSETTQAISVISENTFTVTVTDANGCTGSSSVSTNQYSSPSPSISGILSICDGSNTTLDAGAGYTNYFWSSNETSQTILVTSPGAYNVVVTDNNNCTASTSATISSLGTVPSQPSDINGSSGACRGECGIVYGIAPVNGATSYNWLLPQGATGLSAGTTISLCFNNNFAGGNVCVNAANSCGTSQDFCKYISKINSPPTTPGSILGPTTICPNTTANFSVSTSTNTSGYAWTVTGGLIINSGNGTNLISVSAPAGFISGNIKVKAINCKGKSGTRIKNISGLPFAPVFKCSWNNNRTTGVCSNSTHDYEVSSIAGVSSFTWSAPVGCIINDRNGHTGNPLTVYGPDPNGKFKVSITYPSTFNSGNVSIYATNSCGNGTSTTLEIHSTPVQPMSISGYISGVCNQNNKLYKVIETPGATSYTWTVPSGVIITGNYGSSIKVKYLHSFSSGLICVIATNSCGSSEATCLPVSATPAQPTLINGPLLVCKSETKTYSTSFVSGATAYEWAITGGGIIQQGQGTNNIRIKFSAAISTTATISVRAYNSCGFSLTRMKTVTINLNCKSGEEEVISSYEIDNSFSINPNPATDKTKLTFFTAENSNCSIIVYDLIGNILMTDDFISVNGFNTKEINLENFSKGIYLLSVSNTKELNFTMKLIVN